MSKIGSVATPSNGGKHVEDVLADGVVAEQDRVRFRLPQVDDAFPLSATWCRRQRIYQLRRIGIEQQVDLVGNC